MVQRHISMRGEVVDFNRLRLANSDKPALGNANMNARGDIIGRNGVVLKTQEQIDAEWAASSAAQQNGPGIDLRNKDAMIAAGANPVAREASEPPPPLPKQIDVDDAGFDPVVEHKPRRKIVESDQ